MTQKESSRDRPLAEFENSPAVEVALSVAFQPLANLRTVELGRLWSELFDKRFPKVSEQPRVEMAIEQFGQGSAPTFSFQILDTPFVPRLWFLNQDETQLVQVQNNWFARNWRQMETRANYPHYPAVRRPFEADLKAVLSFVEENDLGTFIPTQCELSYTNHIPLNADGPRDLRDVLDVFRGKDRIGPLGQPESVKAALQWIIRQDSEPVGRLHVISDLGIRRSDGKPVIVLTVTARGRPHGEGVDGVLNFLDRGHEHAVETFVAITSSKMKVIWGMKP
jgi:uncharacterized protein (TIGR04255 family)